MKLKKKIIGLFMCMLAIFVTTSDIIYALHKDVLSGYDQVTNIGGTNETNRLGEKDGVIVSKTITEKNPNLEENLENYFDITLTVRTKTKIEEIIKAQDIAVVIVMDISATMTTNTMDDNSTITRLDEARTAAINFVNKFQEESAKVPESKRQLGFVTFATDSQQVFGLTELETESQRKTMEDSIKGIVAKTGTARYTNMEAGLARAKNMLASSPIKNKYIIFLTDGLPTTYSTTIGGNTGYNPLAAAPVANPTAPQAGLFYNFNTKEHVKKESWAGTNYSDFGARRAENQTQIILNSGITMYSIGVGMSNQHTLYHLRFGNNGAHSNSIDTDTEANNFIFYNKQRYYAITPGIKEPLEKAATNSTVKNLYNNVNIYKTWLKDYMSSGNGYYYDSEQEGDILNAYKNIFAGIKQLTEESSQATWVAEDPMGSDNNVTNVEFLGFYDDNNVLQDNLDKKNNVANQSATASYIENGNKITWDLKNTKYEETKEGNTTYYDYSIRYRIRLKNEKSNFSTNTIYDTNGTTTLTYVLRNSDGFLSGNKYIDFPIPKVVGYLGTLTFTKVSSFDNAVLSGAKFKLAHDPNCLCHKERKYATIEDAYQTSDANGTVIFSNIPSGHTYILTETETPIDHEHSTNAYNITVNHGIVTGGPENNTFINEISKGNLEIQKQVLGNVTNPGEFEFILVVKYKNNPITGIYNYKLNDTIDGTIDLSEGIIKLKKDDKIVIYDLPVGATYTLTETTTNGFKVEYEVNSKGVTLGEIATCDNTNSCRIEKGNTNQVKFINSAGYILPATGSSAMLILIIIGSLLLVSPVIYIGYSFYKRTRNIA